MNRALNWLSCPALLTDALCQNGIINAQCCTHNKIKYKERGLVSKPKKLFIYTYQLLINKYFQFITKSCQEIHGNRIAHESSANINTNTKHMRKLNFSCTPNVRLEWAKKDTLFCWSYLTYYSRWLMCRYKLKCFNLNILYSVVHNKPHCESLKYLSYQNKSLPHFKIYDCGDLWIYMRLSIDAAK